MAAKILITGATGSVGRALVRELIKRGRDVRAGVHTSEKFEYIRMTGVEQAYLEFGDLASIDRALQEIETVYLLTPFAREQVEFTRRVVDRARMWGVDHIVKLSMMNADDVPGTQFTRWHKQAEMYIEDSGIPYTFIRPNMFMQNFLRYVQPSGSLIALPLNHALVSYIDERDVASVSAEVVLAGKEFYGKKLEITGPHALSMEDITDIITKEIHYHIGYISISDDTAHHIFDSIGTPAWMAEGMIELYKMQREGKNELVTPIVQDITEKRPNTFENFTRDYAAVFKAIVQQEHHTHLG